MTIDVADVDLKAKHRVMWGNGDYPRRVQGVTATPRELMIVNEGVGHARGQASADAAGPRGDLAAQRGAQVTASDLTPDLLAAGAARPDAQGLDIEWVEADAEHLPFDDGSYDVVMSAIGVMFAPHHQAAADELVRVCKPGGTVALLSWTPEGMLGDLFATMKPFAAPPPPGAQPPPLWGGEQHLAALFGARVEFHTLKRDLLEITAFPRARDYGAHFKAHYGPTIAVRANAETDGRTEELDRALDAFCDKWNVGTSDQGRFEMEFLLAVGTRR